MTIRYYAITLIIVTVLSHVPHNNAFSAATWEKTKQISSNVVIEKVSTKKRALDVRIFRQFSISAAEYVSKETVDKELPIVTETDAINLLMQGYDERGDYIKFASQTDERPVEFTAVHNINDTGPSSHEDDHDAEEERMLRQSYARQNGVMGVVRAQIRNRRSTTTIGSIRHGSSVTDEMPPHVYLANLRVDDRMRRRGIGGALVSAVTLYTEAQKSNNVNLVLLEVEDENFGAIHMYKRFGFQYVNEDLYNGLMFKMV